MFEGRTFTSIAMALCIAIAAIAYVLIAPFDSNNHSVTTSKSVSAPVTDKYPLLIGKPFPEVEMINSNGESVSTHDLLMRGKVVLFLEPGCNGCDGMISKWNDLLNRRVVSSDEIMGITFQPPSEAGQFRAQKNITFPLYLDTCFTFMNRHSVTEFPLMLVVGKSGTIHESTYSISRQIFPDQLRRWLDN